MQIVPSHTRTYESIDRCEKAVRQFLGHTFVRGLDPDYRDLKWVVTPIQLPEKVGPGPTSHRYRFAPVFVLSGEATIMVRCIAEHGWMVYN